MVIPARMKVWAGAPVAGLVLSAGVAWGQTPAPGIQTPSGGYWTPPPLPAGVVYEQPQPGALHQAWAQFSYKMHDRVIGYPQNFVEPAPGATVFAHYVGHKRAAMPHRFFFYQSDFVAGTDRLTAEGVMRLSRMMAELDRWPGPILVEPLNDSVELTEKRKASISSHLALAGVPAPSDRVMLAYSPYEGVIGDYSGTTGGFPQGIYSNFLTRSHMQYPNSYPEFQPINVFTLGQQGGSGQ